MDKSAALARLGLRVTPSGANLLFLPETEKDKPAGEKEKPAEPSARKLTATLDWSDYLTGVQPRLHFKSTAAALRRLTSERWGGYVVVATPMSGSDPAAYFVSRAAFDATLTPEGSLRELLDHIAGEGVADRVLKGFAMVEEAAEAVDVKKITPAAPDAETVAAYLTTGARSAR